MTDPLLYLRYDLPAVDERGAVATIVITHAEGRAGADVAARHQLTDMGYPPPDVMPAPTELVSAVVNGIDIHEAMMERLAAEHQTDDT